MCFWDRSESFGFFVENLDLPRDRQKKGLWLSWLERLVCNEEVGSSTLPRSTKFRVVRSIPLSGIEL